MGKPTGNIAISKWALINSVRDREPLRTNIFRDKTTALNEDDVIMSNIL